MADTFTETQGLLFAEMDARAREVVEKKFHVRLDSAQSSENIQAAWALWETPEQLGWICGPASWNEKSVAASLKGLEPNGNTTLENPKAEVVSETLPVTRWKAFGDSYAVSLYDSRRSLNFAARQFERYPLGPPSVLPATIFISGKWNQPAKNIAGHFEF